MTHPPKTPTPTPQSQSLLLPQSTPHRDDRTLGLAFRRRAQARGLGLRLAHASNWSDGDVDLPRIGGPVATHQWSAAILFV